MANSIHPCLWFDNQAREAANFYTSIFPNSKIINDTGMVVNFELNGQRFMGLNGRNDLKFNEAVSIVISCENQDEIDHYWDKPTSNGGSEGRCGWCKDNLIDEYHLFVNSAALGSGLPIFKQRTNLKLKSSETFDCGIVVLHYEKG